MEDLEFPEYIAFSLKLVNEISTDINDLRQDIETI